MHCNMLNWNYLNNLAFISIWMRLGRFFCFEILRISIEIFNRNQRMFLFLGRAGADGIPGKDGRDGTPGCNTNLKLFSKLNTQADDHNW